MRSLPRFWAHVDGGVTTAEGQPLALRLWGWSTTSVQDAARVAAQRLEQAAANARAGADLGRYYPRLPLREEVLADVNAPDGTLLAVVTRNRYGAEVLNTDLVLIADLDLPPAPATPGGLIGRLLGRRPDPHAGQAADDAAHGRIDAFALTHPELGVHTYRTAAGLRVFVTGGDLPPGTPAAGRVLTALESDPVYVMLCSTHQTYRARLTPKPWRCGITGGMPVPWPYESPGAAERAHRWLGRYEAASAGWATCRLVSRRGPAPDPSEQQVLALHDAVTRCIEELPLA